MIGFEESEVQVLENITDGVKLLCVNVSDGELTGEISINVEYKDQTAVGKYIAKDIS